MNRVTIPMIRRMEALHGAGLGLAAIAAVVNLDYGTTLTAHGVRYRLRTSDGYEPAYGGRGRVQMAKDGNVPGVLPPAARKAAA